MPIKLVSEDDTGNTFRQIQVSPATALTPLGELSWSGRQLANGPAICMYGELEDIEAAEEQLGRQVDAVLAFTDHTNTDITVNTFPFEDQWPGDRKLILSHALSVDGWDMVEAGDGTHDAEYLEAVENLVPFRDRIFALRIGWEFNATAGFPWTVGGNGTNQSAANYVLAFARFAAMVREFLPEVLIDWCPLWDQGVPDAWYPGDAYVDVIGNDVYLNSAFWTDQFYDALFNTDADLSWQEAFAQAHGKYMSIPEFGSNFNTGTWVDSMLRWMKRPRASRVLYHCFWNSAVTFDSSFAAHPLNAAAYYKALTDKSASQPR